MSHSMMDHGEEDADSRLTSDELAIRAFTISMVGVVAAILLMIVLGYG